MNRRGPFLFLVGLLFLAGVATAVFRHTEYRIPFLPGAQQTVWQIEARVEYAALGGSTQVYLTLPPEQSGYRLLSETGASSGFGFSLSPYGAQRRAHWTKRDANGEQVLYYTLELVHDPGLRVADTAPGPADAIPWDEPFDTAVDDLLQSIMPLTADPRSVATQIIAEMNTQPIDQNMSLLLDRFEPAELLARMLTSANVVAKTVQGLELEDGRRRRDLQQYVQVWQGNQWHLFEPDTGPVDDTRNLLLWQTDTPSVLEVLGGTSSRVTFAMISQVRPMLDLSEVSDNELNLSLYSLPVAEQGMFKMIMLLPVGALMVVFMRLVIGLKTSGTFMPVLIALAFLQTELIPGVASFLLVVAIGLLIRSYLSALNLLLVARIATLVILVIAMITVFSVVSYRLGIAGGLTISFFPMIILAWTIERMSIIWEEEGPKEVLIQGGGSLLVAILAFLLMDQELVRHWAFNFPELHLCVLAVIMLLGRYTGYRLLELRRFAPFKTEAA